MTSEPTETEAIELSVRTLDLRVEIDDAPPPAPTPELEAVWNDARAKNPRLFNGNILAMTGINGSTIMARRDTYQRLAVQTLRPELVSPRIDQLAVTGVLCAPDADGRTHVLVGRRSESTRVYGGLWEFAPGGGVDAPPLSQTRFDGGDLFRQLLAEIREELNLPGPTIANLAPGPAVALTPDAYAGSTDVVIRVDLPARVEDLVAAGSDADRWEYETARWIRLADLLDWQTRDPDAFIPPARPLATLLAGYADQL